MRTPNFGKEKNKEVKKVKFRAWDKKNKRWLDIDGLHEHTGFAAWGCDYRGIETLHLGGTREDEDIEWLQYTGLEDKNGKEIYVGDIVKEKCSRQSGTYHWENIYEVECDAPNGGFNLRDGHGKYEELFYQDLEIIGTIYENPELLEKKAQLQ